MLLKKAQIAVQALLGVQAWLADGDGQEDLTWGLMLDFCCTLVALLDAAQSAACADFAGVVQALSHRRGVRGNPLGWASLRGL